ncbi:MAG: methyltransferase [Anaerolineales bacterium]|jgi:protein-S-isoprenylcysteine O-methyltransferase Ste14
MALKLVIFLIGSAFLAYVSRASLRVPGSHGFYRFLAWEFIIILFLFVLERWFRDPFSPAQLISWLLLSISTYLVLSGIYQLRMAGRAGAAHREEPLFNFEKTSTLVTTGPYRFIRHPLYSSLLFLTWGIFFKQTSFVTAFLALAATLLLMATARADEAECLRYFGDAYRHYMRRTKMFIPFIF